MKNELTPEEKAALNRPIQALREETARLNRENEIQRRGMEAEQGLDAEADLSYEAAYMAAEEAAKLPTLAQQAEARFDILQRFGFLPELEAEAAPEPLAPNKHAAAGLAHGVKADFCAEVAEEAESVGAFEKQEPPYHFTAEEVAEIRERAKGRSGKWLREEFTDVELGCLDFDQRFEALAAGIQGPTDEKLPRVGL